MLDGLSLAVGVAVVEAFESLGIQGVSLKWPNDLLYQEQKLGGILLEMTGDAAGPCQVVVGVGINVDMSAGVVESIDQPWSDLCSIATAPVSRNQLLGYVLDRLLLLLVDYEEQGFASYRDRWLLKDAFGQQQVAVQRGQEKVIGKACGVDESGALLLEVEGDMLRFNGGEVSLRKQS